MKKTDYLEIICFILFCIGTIIIGCFHEPWFDEFQAWGISKDSIYNILFVIPHTEGHPPLWYLILKCFSHFNVNCELGIKIPNLLFMFGAVWLLIFKSPFPRSVKLLLPFTYFIFYQYSIISRPYSIFCFAMFLAAVFYKERNEHPFKFILALALLCLSSAYGMVISTGIILAWLIELIGGGGYNAKKKLAFVKDLIKDKRFYAMFIVFLLCFVLTCIIFPYKNALGMSHPVSGDSILKFVYSYFILPLDALVSDFYNWSNLDFFNLNSLIFFEKSVDSNLKIMLLKFWLFGFCGLIITICLFFIFKYFSKLLILIPYFMLLTLLYIYMGPHHTGLVTVFYIFSFWLMAEEVRIKIELKYKYLIYVCVLFIIFVQIYWSICSSNNEIKYNYSVAREAALYIKTNNLDKYKIMADWLYYPPVFVNKKTHKMYIGSPVDTYEKYLAFSRNYELIIRENLSIQHNAVCINQYFNRNIFYNFNIDNKDKLYSILKKTSPEINNTLRQKWYSYGAPDVIIGVTDIVKTVFEPKNNNIFEQYKILKTLNQGFIWKNKYISGNVYIYKKR